MRLVPHPTRSEFSRKYKAIQRSSTMTSETFKIFYEKIEEAEESVDLDEARDIDKLIALTAPQTMLILPGSMASLPERQRALHGTESPAWT